VENGWKRFSDLHEATPQVLEKIAHDVLDDIDRGLVHARDAKEELKTRSVKARLIYNETLISAALDAAEGRRRYKRSADKDDAAAPAAGQIRRRT
jgi:hypothetical protein